MSHVDQVSFLAFLMDGVLFPSALDSRQKGTLLGGRADLNQEALGQLMSTLAAIPGPRVQKSIVGQLMRSLSGLRDSTKVQLDDFLLCSLPSIGHQLCYQTERVIRHDSASHWQGWC